MAREDPILDSAVRKALASRIATPPGSCPDDNAVIAYLEHRLLPSEKASFEDHASSCIHCQGLLSLSMKLAEDKDATAKPKSHPGRDILFRFSLPIPALALLIVAAGVTILFFREMRQSRLKPATTETAQLRLPKDAPESSVKGKKEAASVREDTKISALTEERKTPARKPATQIATADRLKEGVVSQDKLAVVSPRDGALLQPVAHTELEGKQLEKDSRAESEIVGVKRIQAAAGASATRVDAAENARELSMQLTPQDVILGFSQQDLEQERAVRIAPMRASDARTQTAAGPSTSRRLGDRTFYLVSGYWIDAQCRKHPKADVVELTPDSGIYADIRKSVGQIDELRSSGVPVLVHWNGKNYLVR